MILNSENKNQDPNVSSYNYNVLPSQKIKDQLNENSTLSPKQQRQLRRLSKAFGIKTSQISIVSPDGVRRMIHPKYTNYENMKRIY
uniref:HTH psq-type domain-containing protein n=1 Tax=Parastrongyloides trichosuri TaxID=131310 RepID=A0A0N5A1C0_PARTI